MSFKVYDPDQVKAIICGIPISGGWAEDSMITIQQKADNFVSVAGVGGDVTRSKVLDKRAIVKLKLLQSSDENALLSALANLDANASNGAGVGPSTITDKGGTALFSGAKSWISRPPDVEFAGTAKEREWTIEIAEIDRFDGSN